MVKLNQIAAQELRWPKVGSLSACSICGRPDTFRFLGVKRGKGQWETLDGHSLADCRAISPQAQERP